MKKIIYAVAMILWMSSFCLAQEMVVTAACDPWPPYVDQSAPGEGLSLEIIRASFANQGYTVKMNYLPWARAEEDVKKGKYDILAAVWMTEKRKTDFMFSEPYAVNNIKFIKRLGDTFEFTGLSSLTGKTVGTIRGYGYNDAFMKATNFHREEADNFMINFKKLIHSSKRIDLTLEDEIVAKAKISKENPEFLKQVEFCKKALSSNNLYVAIGLANPRHKELIDAFHKGLAQIKTNGEYTNILKKYGITID